MCIFDLVYPCRAEYLGSMTAPSAIAIGRKPLSPCIPTTHKRPDIFGIREDGWNRPAGNAGNEG